MGAPRPPPVMVRAKETNVGTRVFLEQLQYQLDLALLGVCFGDWLARTRRIQTLQHAQRWYRLNMLCRRSWTILREGLIVQRRKRLAQERWSRTICMTCFASLRRRAHLVSVVKAHCINLRARRLRCIILSWSRFAFREKIAAAIEHLVIVRADRRRSSVLRAWSGMAKLRSAQYAEKRRKKDHFVPENRVGFSASHSRCTFCKGLSLPGIALSCCLKSQSLRSCFLALKKVPQFQNCLSESFRKGVILSLCLRAFQRPILLRRCFEAWSHVKFF